MKNNPTYLPVVAGAIGGASGTWLMHRRPIGRVHGGLWEFPGGKVEPGELPRVALIRELEEELGITVAADCLEPACFADSGVSETQPPIVIMLYTVSSYAGEVQALEGEAIGWFDHGEISVLDKPPLDIELAAKLRLLFPQ